MTIWICWILGLAGPVPDVRVDDAQLTPNGLALESPSVALFWNGDLFIGDYRVKRVFVRRKDGTLETIGAPGKGPEEFNHHVEHLSVRDESLVIEEWNRWREYRFSQAGKILSKKRLERFDYELNGSLYRKLEAKYAIEKGFLYEKVGTDTYVCRLESADFEGIHLSRGYLKAGPKGTVVAFKRGGILEVYDPQGKRTHRMILPLEVFKKDMEEDKVSTQVAVTVSDYGKGYQGGIPLIDGAAESLSRI